MQLTGNGDRFTRVTRVRVRRENCKTSHEPIADMCNRVARFRACLEYLGSPDDREMRRETVAVFTAVHASRSGEHGSRIPRALVYIIRGYVNDMSKYTYLRHD